jgi:hypothetical protein
MRFMRPRTSCVFAFNHALLRAALRFSATSGPCLHGTPEVSCRRSKPTTLPLFLCCLLRHEFTARAQPDVPVLYLRGALSVLKTSNMHAVIANQSCRCDAPVGVLDERRVAASRAAAKATTPTCRRAGRAGHYVQEMRETRYARSGDGGSIAYQVIGDGPVDVVLVPGFISHVELVWTVPSRAEMLERLATFSRLIVFDKRGTGMSDRVEGAPTLETRMDDVRAVMDAAASAKAAILGVSEGVPMSLLLAASHRSGRARSCSGAVWHA